MRFYFFIERIYIYDKKLCTNFVNFICEDNFNDEDKEVMEYVLRVMIFEFLKITGNLIIFYFIGYFIEALIIMLSISLIKPFIGGYHSTTQIRCFFITFVINISIIQLSKNCTLNLISLTIILTASFMAIYHQAPVINKHMPITKPKLIKKNRKRGLINLILISIITIVFHIYNIYYSYILTWSILSLALLMFNRLSWEENLK